MDFFFFAVWTTGVVEIYFQHLKNRRPFDNEAARLELMTRLNTINGFNLTPELLTRRPTRALALLKDRAALQSFFDAIDWAISQAKAIT